MTDWAKLKVVDLKAELKSRGLSYAGLKSDLVARLEEAESGQDESAQAMEAVEGGTKDEAEEHEGGSTAQDEDPERVMNPLAVDGTVEASAEGLSEPIPAPAENVDEPARGSSNDALGTTAEPVSTNLEQASPPAVAEENALPHVPEPQESASLHASSAQDGDSIKEKAEEVQHAPSLETLSPPSNITSPARETGAETNKRKRRSLSPPPVEEDILRKRARVDDDSEAGVVGSVTAPDVKPVDETADVAPVTGCRDSGDEVMQDVSMTDASRPHADPAVNEEDEDARDVVPSVHPATSALYISNLMRPLRPQDVRDHLSGLATRPGDPINDDVISNFFLDQIRTHAFVVFDSVYAASRVRTALHAHVWPNESNRKALWVDFVPPEKVDEWISTEEASSDRRSTRWEVVYKDGPDGSVEARLETGSRTTSLAGPPPSSRAPAPAFGGTNTIPIGPRGYREPGQPAPPTGPRAKRPGTGPGPRPAPLPTHFEGGAPERTRAFPVITYQTVSEDVARRRIANMRSFYTTDKKRRLGRDINRYSFENGDAFVDRGKEIFEGIRPPHRERERRRGGGTGPRPPFGPSSRGGGRPRRGGPPPFRPRSDRYLPGADDGRRSPPRSRDDRGSYRSRDYRDRY
ncbi:hypothetical protein S40288_04611 [Stachybotrys chartarum IBT 40288]|nr:hypothetical protein S40288_04611 [Stachybotrys chartarum IBT 40288]